MSSSAGGATDDKTGANHTALHLIKRYHLLYLVYENGGCLFANHTATLLYGGEHGVAGLGPVAIGKPAY